MRKMLFCNKCKKEVVIYGVSAGAPSEGLDEMASQMEKEGKIVLFNPPPFPPYNCPNCGTELIEK